MLNLIIWIVVGAIIGWLASIVTGRNQQQGFLIDIVVGIVGAFLGGVIYNMIIGQGLTLSSGVNITSLGGFVVALIGAVVLLAILNLMTRR
jgi:uncharacterized membrane protein YeaQ/YmgE (transglycosylase-associated protein family)